MTLSARRVAALAAWSTIAAVIVATLCPIGLRPQTGHPDLERFGAFCLAGALFAAAYPGKKTWVAAALLAAAFVSEALQALVPDRDARLLDAVIKAGGALSGVLVVKVATRPNGGRA